jgi:hypothetical protein
LHQIDDEIVLVETDQIVLPWKTHGVEITAFDAGAAEAALGEVEDITGEHLALAPLRLLAVQADAVGGAGLLAGTCRRRRSWAAGLLVADQFDVAPETRGMVGAS